MFPQHAAADSDIGKAVPTSTAGVWRYDDDGGSVVSTA
jgi:hypothetical protein